MRHMLWRLLMVALVPYWSLCGEAGRGVRSLGLGGARAVVPDDVWALVHNPAALSLTSGTRVSAFMMPALFGLKELRSISACTIFPLAGGPCCVSVEQFGFDLYKEFSIAAGFGRTLEEGFAGGFSLEWRKTAIRGYGESNSWVVSGGCVVRFSNELHLGFVGENILGETIGSVREPLPQKAAMGISYNPVPDLWLILEGEKDTRYPITTRAGLELGLLENLRLRMGVAHGPTVVSGGVSIHYGGAEFGYTAFGHANLGWTHCIEASMSLGD